jgi:hypothetical protein
MFQWSTAEELTCLPRRNIQQDKHLQFHHPPVLVLMPLKDNSTLQHTVLTLQTVHSARNTFLQDTKRNPQ